MESLRKEADSYVIRNRRHFGVLNNSVKRVSHPDKPGSFYETVSWYTIFSNIFKMIIYSPFGNMMIPFFLIFIWNTCVCGIFDEVTQKTIAGAIFFVKNTITGFVFLYMQRKINNLVSAGGLNEIVEVETTEYTDDGDQKKINVRKTTAEYDLGECQSAFL